MLSDPSSNLLFDAVGSVAESAIRCSRIRRRIRYSMLSDPSPNLLFDALRFVVESAVRCSVALGLVTAADRF
jgi:hypothetical protein